MKYLVTGGAGFIGSHLTEYLLENNHLVICVDDFSSGLKSNLYKHKNLTIIEEKIQGFNINSINDIDGIFHLAAQASVPFSIDNFYLSSRNNILSSLRIWDYVKQNRIPIVYASSSAVYGNLPLGDDRRNEYDILSPYAQDKLTMEDYANMSWKIFKTPSIGLRFFNVYGPKQDPSNPYSGVISIFIDRLLKEKPITVNGCYQTRDFIYVKDIVKSLILSMNKLHKSDICETFNVGTGTSVSVDNLLEILINLTKKNPKIIRAKLPVGDPEVSIGTYTKLQSLIKLNINDFTSLLDGLKQTLTYYED